MSKELYKKLVSTSQQGAYRGKFQVVQERSIRSAIKARGFEIKDLGDFSITYFPFESYRDFWGKAQFDATAGTLTMTTTGGNRVPANADLSGKATLTPGGQLILSDVFLSEPQTTGGVCTYTFGK